MLNFRSVYLDAPIIQGRALDLFEPENSRCETALFFIHGGGWKSGSRTIYHPIIEACLERGYEVATTDYRLNKDLFTQVEDIRDALAYYADDLERRGRKRRVVLMGCSAGAHLSLLTALLPGEQPVEIAGVVVQAAPFLFEPWEDIFPAIWTEMQFAARAQYNEEPEIFRRAAPITHLAAGSPPVLIMHAENEHMFPLWQAEQYACKAKELGVPVRIKVYPRVEHGFFYNLDRWQQREALEDLLRFVDAPGQ